MRNKIKAVVAVIAVIIAAVIWYGNVRDNRAFDAEMKRGDEINQKLHEQRQRETEEILRKGRR